MGEIWLPIRMQLWAIGLVCSAIQQMLGHVHAKVM